MTVNRPIEIPKLPGWLTTVEAAQALGTDKATVYKMIFEDQVLRGVRAVGDKPVYLIPARQVHRLQQRIAQQRDARTVRRRGVDEVKQRNRMIKAWGAEHGFAVSGYGAPSRKLVAAWRACHPNG